MRTLRWNPSAANTIHPSAPPTKSRIRARFRSVGDASAAKKPWTVRVTHAYRREDGELKIVHRHGNLAPVDESPPADGETV